MLTSSTSVPVYRLARVKLSLGSAGVLLFGLYKLIAGAGWVRALGALTTLVGSAMVVTVVRDFRLWRAEVRRRP